MIIFPIPEGPINFKVDEREVLKNVYPDRIFKLETSKAVHEDLTLARLIDSTGKVWKEKKFHPRFTEQVLIDKFFNEACNVVMLSAYKLQAGKYKEHIALLINKNIEQAVLIAELTGLIEDGRCCRTKKGNSEA